MTTSPRVTVGVPVYNGEATLEETLDSLLQQDFDDFEVIVSDNASTDRTGEIVQSYVARDPRVRYVRQPTNVGAAKNYNVLVDLARGELFKWHSADDLAAPSLLSRCVETLDHNPLAVLAYPGTVLIDESGRRIGDHQDGMNLPQSDVAVRLRRFALDRSLCNPCFGVMRRSALARTGLIRSYISSDITFLAELTLAGPVLEIPERLFFRRVAASSCGLGGLSKSEVARWFDPARRAGLVSPLVLVYRDVVKAILRDPVASPSGRLRNAWSFSEGWFRRHTGIMLWRLRRRARGGRRSSVYQSTVEART